MTERQLATSQNGLACQARFILPSHSPPKNVAHRPSQNAFIQHPKCSNHLQTRSIACTIELDHELELNSQARKR